MSGIVLHLRNGLPTSLAPDYRITNYLVPSGSWTSTSISHQIVVPTGKVWIPLSASMTLTAAATIGTRRLRYRVQDSAGTTVLDVRSYINHTVGLSVFYQWGLGLENMAAAIASNYATVTLPDYVLTEGYKIIFDEMNAVDSANDSLTTPVMMVLEHDATP